MLVFRGTTLLQRARNVLADVCDEMLYVAPEPPPLPVEAKHVIDRFPGMGVLSGIHAALCEAAAPRVICIAVDTPLLTGDWLRLLASRCEESGAPCVPRVGGRVHPVPGCYPVSALSAIEHSLADGQATARRVLPELGAVYVDEAAAGASGCLPEALTNVNSPEDWRALLEAYGRR